MLYTTTPIAPEADLPNPNVVGTHKRNVSLTTALVPDVSEVVTSFNGLITPSTVAKLENEHAVAASEALAQVTKSEQQCLLFPTYATRMVADSKNPTQDWDVRVMGWAFAQNPASTRRRLVMGLARTVAGVSRASDPAATDLFESRFGFFLARNVRDQSFTVEVIGTTATNHMGIDADDPNPAESQHLPHDDPKAKTAMLAEPAAPRTPSAASDRTLIDQDSFGETLADSEDEEADTIPEQPQDYFSQIPASVPVPTSSVSTSLSPASTTNTPNSSVASSLTSSDSSTSSSTSTSPATPISSSSTSISSSSTSTSLATATTGHFIGSLRIPTSLVAEWGKEQSKSDPRLLKIRAFSGFADSPSYGFVSLIEPDGVSVISDIDDTIKDTQILAGTRVVLSNTFLNEAKQVPGMAELYMRWHSHLLTIVTFHLLSTSPGLPHQYDMGAAFHYVSNSPFQLLPMLQSFFRRSNFPPGSAHLRLYSGVLAKFTEVPGQAKRDRILEIMNDFPDRRFVLIGDSGEIDLEIYSRIAKENTGRVIAIFVRDVTTRAFQEKLEKEREKVLAAQATQGVSRTRSFPLSFGTVGSLASLDSVRSEPTVTITQTPMSEEPDEWFTPTEVMMPKREVPTSAPMASRSSRRSSRPSLFSRSSSSMMTPESERLSSGAPTTPSSSRPSLTSRSSSTISTSSVFPRPSRFGITSSFKRAFGYDTSAAPLVPTPSLSTSTVTATARPAFPIPTPSRSASTMSTKSTMSTRSSTMLVRNEVDMLNDRVRKAREELEETGTKVVLFQKADELGQCGEVEEALRGYLNGKQKMMAPNRLDRA
ncbi:hypothetical protein BC938DRAFT_480181 [Jimgerdemannia flammicorona]|uniref:Phosphatidate phosphatase APP1 catalytic domain-containing protein n=1 Tax=Jimgerdemannia flammicorona TaxID=994334 RepID=A0A433QJ75_9FUNG|nr:hypothetical protein BC938DRAFT_480181 [Jimgerdemannia flammicorona]